MNIVFATCQTQPQISNSDALIAQALEQAGATVTGAPWNGAWSSFEQADAVVIRTTWDYFDHFHAFVDWLDQLEDAGMTVFNSLRTLRWNIHKRYLFDLQRAGAPLLPMTEVSADSASIQQAARANGWRRAVLKCLVSGTARGLSLFEADSDEQIARALEVAAPWSEFGLIVQPFMPQIQTDGELSMVFIDGDFSHAVCKTPKADEFRIQSEFGGTYQRVEPDAASVQSAQQCLDVATQFVHDTPLYARVDGLVVDGQFQLMELELSEPELMIPLAPDAAGLFARSVLARLGS